MLAQQDPYNGPRPHPTPTADASASTVWGRSSRGNEKLAGKEGDLPKLWFGPKSEALSLLGAFIQWYSAGGDESAAMRCK